MPLVIVGDGISRAVDDTPVSRRHVAHTLLDFARIATSGSLRHPPHEVVLGEAMTPFLEYGWQPQVMAIEGRYKTIFAGRPEIYDVLRDPAESRDLSAGAVMSRPVRAALRSYPLPTLDPISRKPLSSEDQRNLASLGYVTSGGRPVVDRAAPRPADMTHLFDRLERANLERVLQGE